MSCTMVFRIFYLGSICCLHERKSCMVKTQSLNNFCDFFLFSAFADAAVDPIDFPIAPAYAVPKVRIKLEEKSKLR